MTTLSTCPPITSFRPCRNVYDCNGPAWSTARILRGCELGEWCTWPRVAPVLMHTHQLQLISAIREREDGSAVQPTASRDLPTSLKDLPELLPQPPLYSASASKRVATRPANPRFASTNTVGSSPWQQSQAGSIASARRITCSSTRALSLCAKTNLLLGPRAWASARCNRRRHP